MVRCMPSATVKFYSESKGYGFLLPDDGGADVFLHITEVKRAKIGGLIEGAKVSYDLADGKPGKGPKAINLKLNKAEAA